MQKNIFNEDIEECCINPITGFYRDGFCNTDQLDFGTHTVCTLITNDFLEFSKSMGNDLSTPRPEFDFPGLKEGDKWCVCADEEGFKWAEAYMTGGKPNMKRDAYIWMLNGDMGEDNMNSSFYGGDHDKAKMMGHFIESGPHLMLMPKDTKTIENFPTDFTTGAPYQMFKGTPYAHLMIPVEGYYEFQPDSNPLN